MIDHEGLREALEKASSRNEPTTFCIRIGAFEFLVCVHFMCFTITNRFSKVKLYDKTYSTWEALRDDFVFQCEKYYKALSQFNETEVTCINPSVD